MKIAGKKPWYLEYLLIIVGTGLMGTAITSCFDAAGMVTGGFSGIAILVKAWTKGLYGNGIPLWITNLILNVPLFLLATKIKGFAFWNCNNIKKIEIPNSVKVIEKQAFYKCTALTQIGSKASTITLPAVQKLYSGAFQNCSKISRITISSKSLKTVESKAITGINKKAVIRVPASKLTAYKKIFKTSTGYVKTMKITK